MKKITLLLSIIISLLLLTNQIVLAQSTNKVAAYLIIPDDWRDRVTPDIMQRYKQNILKSLQVAQDFYASKLNGHTFVYDQNVKVNVQGVGQFNLNKIEENSAAQYNIGTVLSESSCGTAALLDQLSAFGPRSIAHPFHAGEIRIYYIVGSRDLLSCATTSPHGLYGSLLSEGEAYINHESLESIDDNLDPQRRDFALGTVIHELGHTFGLSYGGFARGHTCSAVQKDACKSGVGGFLGPYPSVSECKLSIMSYCHNPLSEKGLANSTYNPEIHDIFNSPFINPNHDPNPSPQILVQTPQSKITSISPNPLTVGSDLIIEGVGLGDHNTTTRGLDLQNPSISFIGMKFEEKKWENSEVILTLKEYPYSYLTTWKLGVINDEEKIYAPGDLLIAPASPASVPSPSEVLVSNLNTPSPSPSATELPSPTPQACTVDCVATSDQCDRIGVPAEGVCSSGVCCKINPTPTPTPTPTPSSTVSPSLLPSTTPSLSPCSGQCVATENICNRQGGISNEDFCSQGICCVGTSSVSSPTPTSTETPTPAPSQSPGLTSTPTPSPTPNVASPTPAKKVITKVIVVNGTQILDITSSPNGDLPLHLPGQEGVAGTYQVRIQIYYSDNTMKTIPFNFNYQPVTTSSTPPSPSVSQSEVYCNQIGGACQDSCSGTQTQRGTCEGSTKGNLCCVGNTVATPQANASKCPGQDTTRTGVESWGTSCRLGDPDKVSLANGGAACTVASCFLKSDINEYCFYNSGAFYGGADNFESCKAKGVTITTPAPVSTIAPTPAATAAPAYCDTTQLSGSDWYWSYNCDCQVNGEPGHHAICSVNPGQAPECFTGTSFAVSGINFVNCVRQ